MTDTTAVAKYSGWQSEKSGWIGDVSGPGVALIGAATAAAVLPLYLHSWPAAAVCLPLTGLLLALAFGRIQGLTAAEWITLAVRHQISVARREHLFLSGVFAPRTAAGDQPLDLPGTLARLRILSAPDGLGGTLAVVHHPVDRTYTAVARITYPELALVDEDRKEARVAGWRDVLRSLCTEEGAITRIAVHQRCLPDDGGALREWAARHIAQDAPPSAVETLDGLMSGAGPVSTKRETYLALTLSASRARLAVRGAGGGQRGACAVLVRELGALRGALAAAALTVEEWLGPRELAAVIRTAYDPHIQPALSAHDALAKAPDWQGEAKGVDPALAGPAAAEKHWNSYRHDGGHSIAYQVRGLPHEAVLATVLQPLMRPRTTARRTLTLLYEPIGPRRARNELSRERTKRRSARILRARTGRDESEDQVREDRTARSQDQARAAGQGVVRLTALLALTVTDPEVLDTAAAELQADASDAGLRVRRVWGGMDEGFAVACLPLGRGLPDRRRPL
ncbi:SCO6880 family protein [Streptomyces nanshensis]|uniref:PrgI family protein n=1 Tax=Streptomyces nanshensis TaxID=518642 RepID=A0A1E7LAU4_9ACTN|nr:SCO6880 family protein [Streptomyces nanshensis]OEV13221.1 hypothetical protein AN218_04530 [Streptomyces nanshensis]